MASTSQITIMRELSAAGDRERTGALDVEWEGARASLFFIFGHANHVEFERADGEKLVGTEALTAIVAELPEEFRVSPWRRAMVTDDTLRCTAEELMFMFRRDPAKSTGRGGPQPSSEDAPAEELPSATVEEEAVAPSAAAPSDDGFDTQPEEAETENAAVLAEDSPAEAEASTEPETSGVPFGVADFPTLPLGAALFSDAAANVEGLAGAVPHLPDSLIVLSAPSARGVVVVSGGSVIDAVWVNESTALLGDEAAGAVFSATEGTIAAHQVADGNLLTDVPALWRPQPSPGAETAGAPEASAGLDTPAADAGAPSAQLDTADAESATATAEATATDAEAAPAETALAETDTAVTEAGTGAVEPDHVSRGRVPEAAVFTLPDVPDTSAAPAPDAATAPPTDDVEVGTETVGPQTAAESVDTATAAETAGTEGTTEVDIAAEAQHATEDSAAGVATGDAELAAPPSDEQLTSAAAEFVPARVEVDIDSLRAELVGIADVWLGEADAAPVAAAIQAARPGVDDFVAAIQAIASMEIPGHEHAVVRAMAREMHFRAAEVLCGV